MVGGADAADIPPCYLRLTMVSEPWVRVGDVACLEQVLHDASTGELGMTAIASAPDGSLYAARPLTGEVIRLIDGDGDGLPETPTIAARGLTLPNALTWHEGALYIAGGAHLVRLDADSTLTVLVDDLPTGAFWTGGVAVLNSRLYVAIGAACDSCPALISGEPLARGGILSFALDGTDRRIEAVGLRSPYGLTAYQGALYVSDSAADHLIDLPDHPNLDEINRVTPGADFGFPACVGMRVAVVESAACDATIAPIAILPTGSTPTAIVGYTGGLIPSFAGRLLVVLHGSRGRVDLRGYQVVAVAVETGAVMDVMPAKPDDSAASDFTVEAMNYRGSGFYPHRPIGLAVRADGWVYISVGGGRVLALRR